MKSLFIAAASAMLSFGAAQAADPAVPITGSQQGIFVPHATPGEPTHRHDSAAEGHITSPTGQVATSAEGGVTPSNSIPGSPALTGKAVPHVDVTSPRGVVPEVGSEQGATPPGLSR